MKKEVKIMVGCRAEPDLKEVLESEATHLNKTLSAYIESILKQRHFADDDVEKLKERIFELETHNLSLQSRWQEASDKGTISENSAELEKKTLAQDVEIRTLKQQKMAITTMYNRAVEERDVLSKMHGKVIPHWMSQDSYNQMVNYLNQLHKQHTKLSHEQLLTLSLATIVKNEKSSYLVYRLSDFLKLKPNFFTTQKAQNQ
jgi:hypothetical protein